MDSNKFMEVVSKHIDQNFNSNNQLVEYVVSELSSLDLNLNAEQTQHIVNIIEYVSKSTSKSTIVTFRSWFWHIFNNVDNMCQNQLLKVPLLLW